MADPSLMSINTLISQLKNGIARKNRYQVAFVLPSGIADDLPFINAKSKAGVIGQLQNQMNLSSGTNGAINTMCNTCQFPQRSLMTYDINQNSAPFGVPYSASYDPLTFTFYADQNLNSRQYFEIWQSTVCNFSNNTMNYPKEYTQDVKMWHLDTTGKQTYGVTLKEAWPITVGSVDYGYADNDSAQIISVTMRYKAWVPQDVNTFQPWGPEDYSGGL